MPPKTFKQLELEGWTERAASYDAITPVTREAIGPILDEFDGLAGSRVLEIACGPGYLASRAAELGASVEAIDFSRPMVELAQSRHSGVSFAEGDAEALSFADDSFDGVICAFGLLHLEHPELAIAEAWRVLKPGGRYVYTVWCPPEEGGEFFGLLMGAIQQHGNMDIALPPAPPFYRFADRGEAVSALESVGFVDCRFDVVPIRWVIQRAQDAVDIIDKSTVRTKAIVDAQTEDARAAIHAAILAGMEPFRTDGGFEVALPALKVTALKPAAS